MIRVIDTPHGAVTASALTKINAIWQAGQDAREKRQLRRLTLPLIRLWDGDWGYIGSVGDAIEASFQWRLNETGTGTIQIPIDSWIGKHIMRFRRKNRKNVHVTMDKDGARWSGRLSSLSIEKDASGMRFYLMTFLHDYEEVKHIYVWPNPFLPATIQFPRSFVLVGPTIWALKAALLLNVRRLAESHWSVPDDPFDLHQWNPLDFPEDWPIQVAPGEGILTDGSPWTVLSSRMKNWHTMAAPKLAESQLMVTTRRWLDGDPAPWNRAKVKHGALIIDIVDKSGYWGSQGTYTSGNIFTGLVRTIQSVTDGVDNKETILTDPASVESYKQPNFLSTSPHAPYVIYRDGPLGGITASGFTWEPARDVQVVAGGSSPYGVNEAISSAVTLVGNYIGGLFTLATGAGAILDKFLAPIYADTLLAWMETKSRTRSRELGWSHYYEHFAEGADKAYTLSSVMALRQGYWETREKLSHKLEIADGAPWFVGENGEGHFFLGDRIGATVEGVPDGMLIVEQVSEITYDLTRSTRGWNVVCGDLSSQFSPLEDVLSRVNEAIGAAHDLGVSN